MSSSLSTDIHLCQFSNVYVKNKNNYIEVCPGLLILKSKEAIDILIRFCMSSANPNDYRFYRCDTLNHSIF